MKEENKGASKNKWSRIFRKKWFFPALYLGIAALLLSVVVWYQNLDNQIPEAGDNPEESENYNPRLHDEDADAVMDPQEVIKMPVNDQDQAEIVTKFYDYNADKEDNLKALVLHNNRYYQSTGIDITSENGEPFDVVASLSGTVSTVKEDPILGTVVIIDHENDVMTYYASLGKVQVKPGEKVKQGDAIGLSGKNIFGKDHGNHVHFELRKDDNPVNPEAYFNQSISKLDSLDAEDAMGEQDRNNRTDELDGMEDPEDLEDPKEDSDDVVDDPDVVDEDPDQDGTDKNPDEES